MRSDGWAVAACRGHHVGRALLAGCARLDDAALDDSARVMQSIAATLVSRRGRKALKNLRLLHESVLFGDPLESERRERGGRASVIELRREIRRIWSAIAWLARALGVVWPSVAGAVDPSRVASATEELGADPRPPPEPACVVVTQPPRAPDAPPAGLAGARRRAA